jgi:hypothetical protein
MAKKKKIPGFSMKRATGVTKMKRKIAKATGIPTTKSGRKAKARRLATGGGCLVNVVVYILLAAFALIVLI